MLKLDKHGYINAHHHSNICFHSGSYWASHHTGHYCASCLSIAGSSGPDEEVEHQVSAGTDPCVCDTERQEQKSRIINSETLLHLNNTVPLDSTERETWGGQLGLCSAQKVSIIGTNNWTLRKQQEKAAVQCDENKLVICLAHTLIYIQHLLLCHNLHNEQSTTWWSV